MNFDDFPFFGSSVASLEPELKLFEVDDTGDHGDNNLLHHHPKLQTALDELEKEIIQIPFQR